MDYSRFIRRRLRNIGVSREDSNAVANWYLQQLQQQGTVGAINYLKRIGDAILWYLYKTPEKPTWVATKHRFPKSVYFLKKYDEGTLARIAKFARAIRLDKVYPHQVNKVVPAVVKPYDGASDGISLITALIGVGIGVTGLKKTCQQPQGPRPIGRVFRSVQSVSGPTAVTCEPPVWESLQIVDRVGQLHKLPYWKECFAPISNDWLDDWFDQGVESTDSQAVGEIHAAQEGGGKLRMYAAPYSIVQCLLYPIHNWIDTFRRQLRTDCTYNQHDGAVWAQGKLLQGITVHSVDLSTATCRFPLEPQLDMLRSLGLDECFIDALEWACRGTWLVGAELQPDFPSTLSWSVGQPLGIVPSMSSFSLAHNLLLSALCWINDCEPEDTFRVLGDDVVICDTSVYDAYCEAVSQAGIPISWNKCHSSDQFAEFAGYSISRQFMIRPGQWREAAKPNHLSLALELGTPLKGEVSPLWQKIEQIYLFREGLFTPLDEEWSEYLRLSSAISECLNYSEIPEAVSGLMWDKGFKRCVRTQFPADVYPEFGPISEGTCTTMSRNLPDTTHVIEAVRWAAYLEDLTPSVDMLFTTLFTGIQTSYVLGQLNQTEFEDAVERLVANTHSLYWRPPLGREVRYKLHDTLSSLLK